MSKRKLNNRGGFVYSTDPHFKMGGNDTTEDKTTIPAMQQLLVRLDTRHRAGKAVTLVEDFTGTAADREALGKKLKTFCGTGGSVKEGKIIIQGDNRDKIMQWLLANGYTGTKKF